MASHIQTQRARLLILALLLLAGCGRADSGAPAVSARPTAPEARASSAPGSATPTVFLPLATRARSGLTAEQKRRAEQLTSLFENGTIELQYGYAEDLGDGRGITSGRAGFTTADGDALEVVALYAQRAPGNRLAPFLPELRRLADAGSDDTSGLDGYADAWAAAARDAQFRSAQDEVVDRLYYQPSVRYADQLGLRTALVRAVLYDTIIQHGADSDPDGLPALLERARTAAGGTPATGVSEADWLATFLTVRRDDLANAHNPDTRDAWAQSVGRCDVFAVIAESGNYDLHGPIEVRDGGYKATIP
jgi:chitosanase